MIFVVQIIMSNLDSCAHYIMLKQTQQKYYITYSLSSTIINNFENSVTKTPGYYKHWCDEKYINGINNQ